MTNDQRAELIVSAAERTTIKGGRVSSIMPTMSFSTFENLITRTQHSIASWRKENFNNGIQLWAEPGFNLTKQDSPTNCLLISGLPVVIARVTKSIDATGSVWTTWHTYYALSVDNNLPLGIVRIQVWDYVAKAFV